MPEESSFFDHECERNIIRMLLLHADARLIVFSDVTVEDFSHNETRTLFRICLKEFEEFGDIDKFKVYEAAGKHNILASDYFDSSFCPTSTFASRYVEELKDLSLKRKLQRAAEQINTASKSQSAVQVIEKAMALLVEAKESGVKREDATVSGIFAGVSDRWERTKGMEVTGIDAGMVEINKTTGGYQLGHFWLIAGYTSYGKSTLAAYLAAQLVELKTPVSIFSTEMSQQQTLEKLISQFCGESVWKIRNNIEEFKEAIDAVVKSPLRIYTQHRSVEAIRLELIGLKMQGIMPPIVFIDFVQNLDSHEGTEYERMTAVAHKLQSLALELNVCILALSQISNEGAANKSEVIPVKGSGALAAAADVIVQIFRNKRDELEEDMYAPFNVVVRKNRHGEVGQTLTLRLNKKNGVLDKGEIPKKDLEYVQEEFWHPSKK